MRIAISSNVVSGVYSCLEVVLVAALTQMLTVVIGCVNVRRIYDEKGEISLWSSPIPCFADLGLSSKKIYRNALLVFTMVVILMVCGEFSIVGLTEERFEEVEVKNLVKRAPSGQAINLERHISLETGLVSAAVHLLSEFGTCALKTPSHSTFYQYKNNLVDLTMQWSETAGLNNSTCIIASEGFKDSIAMENDALSPPPEFRADWCLWRVNLLKMPVNKLTSVTVIHNGECAFPVAEAWCIRGKALSCAGLTRIPGGFAPSLVFGDGNDMTTQRTVRSTIGTSLLKEAPESTVLKSMAMLQAVGMRRAPFDLLIISLLTVETNAIVKRLVGEKDVTEVDILFFCLTTGAAVLISFMTGVLALLLWVKIIVLPDRRSHNRFNSITDIVNYAAAVAFKEDSIHRSRKGIRVGISLREPHVGPLEGNDHEGRSKIAEDEIVGHR